MEEPILALATSICVYFSILAVPAVFVYFGFYKHLKFIAEKTKTEMWVVVKNLWFTLYLLYFIPVFILGGCFVLIQMISEPDNLVAPALVGMIQSYLSSAPAYLLLIPIEMLTRDFAVVLMVFWFVFPVSIFFFSIWFLLAWKELKEKNIISKQNLLKLMLILSAIIYFLSLLAGLCLDRLHYKYEYCSGKILCERF